MVDEAGVDNVDHYAKSSGGLFDIRNVIGGLLGLYGVILVVTGLVNRSAADLAKAGGNVNLWAGIGMLAVAAFFIAWSVLRPVVVASSTQSGSSGDEHTPETGKV